ncbi:unnamed protein product [Parajaminaea phylloscopi]
MPFPAKLTQVYRHHFATRRDRPATAGQPTSHLAGSDTPLTQHPGPPSSYSTRLSRRVQAASSGTVIKKAASISYSPSLHQTEDARDTNHLHCAAFTPMSGFDLTGGLAALRSQILSGDQTSSNPYQQPQHQEQEQEQLRPSDYRYHPSHPGPAHAFRHQASSDGPPQLPRLQTEFSAAPLSNTGSGGVRSAPQSVQRGSAESALSSSERSGQSTGYSTSVTTPNVSMDNKNLGLGQPLSTLGDRRDSSLSAGSTSGTASLRGSNAVFGYSDHLLMSSPQMNGSSSPGFPGSTTLSAAGSRTNSGMLSPAGTASLPGGSAERLGEIMGDMTSALSPVSPSSADRREPDRGKKSNPLQDLIQTERAYVSELSSIIKTVASAWNRANFPPAELDTMFRNIESIYRVNKVFLKALKDIGPEPSSPRPLGDLLMRWIDDLETPYCRYCENCFTDFDSWPAVQSNEGLKQLLLDVSAPTDAAGEPKTFSDKKRQPGDVWTLDSLFALPLLRLRYYKKLYGRLLKSTNPGRSDHRLLIGANEKLDELLSKSQRKISMGVLDDSRITGASERNRASSSTEEQDSFRSSSNSISPIAPISPDSARPAHVRASPSPARAGSNSGIIERIGDLDFGSLNGVGTGSASPSTLAGRRAVVSPSTASPLTVVPPAAGANPPPLLGPLPPRTPLSAEDITRPDELAELPSAQDLESRLDMSRVVDLFTMKPKKCQLRINPPTLPFQRGLRKSSDVVITFTPKSTGEEIVWKRGCVFLLTDLFLICERMHADGPVPSKGAEQGQDMWLLFPPLAGKHLQVSEVAGTDADLSITILKKETVRIKLQSQDERAQWMRAFANCNAFATKMGLKLQNAPSAPAGPTTATSPIISVTPSPSSPPFRIGSMDSTQTGRFGMTSPLGSVRGEESMQSPPMRPLHGGRPLVTGGIRPQNGIASPQSSPMVRPHLGPAHSGAPRPMGGSGVRPESGPAPRPFSPHQQRPQQPGPGPARPPMNGSFPPRPMPRPDGMRPPPSVPFPPASPGAVVRPRTPPAFINRPPPNFNNPPSSASREPLRRPSAPNLRDRANGAMTPPVRTRSASSMGSNGGAPKLPSEMLRDGDLRSASNSNSPPGSPELKPKGPTTSTVSAQMRCRLYLKQSHAQWKSLGNARLKLFHLMPANQRQLVVENDRKMLISTIILPDGVERVGKVGVAVEISDEGNRTGIVYMLQMRSEDSAQGLFGELIDGSGRTIAVT